MTEPAPAARGGRSRVRARAGQGIPERPAGVGEVADGEGSTCEPAWLSRVVVDAIHSDQIREHGGLPGVRDENVLESALARPQQKWHHAGRVARTRGRQGRRERTCGLDSPASQQTAVTLRQPLDDRVQPRCGAQRSNVGCNPLFGLHLVFTQANTVYSSSPALYRPSCTSKPVSRRTRLQVSREKRPIVQ